MVANWIPLEEPAGGPYFGKLDPKARYYVKIDNTGDGREDVAYRWQFNQKFRNPNSFLYAAPTVTSVERSGPQLRPDVRPLPRDVQQEAATGRARSRSRTTSPSRPDNVGPKTIPNYDPVVAGAVAPVTGGGKTFVGPADDPFFVDLGAVFDGINIDKPGRPNIGLGNQGGGKDDVSGYNTHSFVLQVPESQVTRDGKSVGRRQDAPTPSSACGRPPSGSASRCASTTASATTSTYWVQVSRLGNPLINEVIIPIGAEGQVQPDVPRGRPGELRQVRPQPGAGASAQRPVQPRRQGDQPDRHRPGAAHRRARTDPDRQQPGAGRHAEAQPRRAAQRDREPLRRARRRPGRLPERPPSGRRRDRHRAARHRRRAAARRPGRQADPARRRRRPERQAVPSAFPYVASPTDGFTGIAKRTEPAHAPVPQPPGV